MEERKYYNEFKRYMKTIHKIDLNDYNGYVYVVHLQGCEDCISSSLKLLNSIPEKYQKDILLITVGKQLSGNIFLENISNKKYHILQDNMQTIFDYQTNFAYPLFVKIDNGKLINYKEVTFNVYPDIVNVFNE